MYNTLHIVENAEKKRKVSVIIGLEYGKLTH